MKNCSAAERFAAAAMAAALVFSSAPLAFASQQTGTLKIEASSETGKTKNYNVYKLLNATTQGTAGAEGFSVAYTVNEKYRSVLKKALNITDTSLTDAQLDLTIVAELAKIGSGSSTVFNSDTINSLENGEVKEDSAEAFAKELYKNIAAGSIAADKTMTSGGSESVDFGYYLIKDVTSGADMNSRYMVGSVLVESTDGVTVNVKEAGVPTLDKYIVDGGFGKEADLVGAGDTATFGVTTTIPDGFSSFEKKIYTIHDNVQDTMTVQRDSVVAKVVSPGTTGSEGTTTTLDSSKYTVTWPTSGDDTFSVKIDESVFDADLDSGSVILEYKVTMDDAAASGGVNVGGTGNDAYAYLEYSNDAYSATSTDHTKKDYISVYVAEADLTKMNADETKCLTGATFELYGSQTANGVTTASGTKIGLTAGENGTYYVDPDGSSATITVASASGSEGKIRIVGLDNGTYFLKETAAPSGYQLPANPYFAITLTAAEKSASVTDTISDGTENFDSMFTLSGSTTTGDYIKSIKGSADNTAYTDNSAVLSANIVNYSGTVLPTTGGRGKAAFAAAGILLMAGSGTVFVKRRKKKNA